MVHTAPGHCPVLVRGLHKSFTQDLTLDSAAQWCQQGLMRGKPMATHLFKAGQLPEVLQYLHRGPRSVHCSWRTAISRHFAKGLTAGRSRGHLFANVPGCHICSHCGLYLGWRL